MGNSCSSNKQNYQCSSPTPNSNVLLGNKQLSVGGAPEVAKPSKRLTVNGVSTGFSANSADASVEFTEEELLLDGKDVLNLLKGVVQTGKCQVFQSKMDPNVKDSFKNKLVTKNPKNGILDKTIGFACKKGLKPKTPNQDSWSIVQGGDDFCMYIVCDGHGHDGHTVSDLAINMLPKFILHHAEFKSNLSKVLALTFEKMHQYIVKSSKASGFDADLSGCTGTVVFHDKRAAKLIVAHVGDSGSCLGVKDGCGPVKKARVLIEDHKPEQPEEKARIEAQGGRVEWDGYANHRVYGAQTDTPGMNMSRALGDDLGHRIAGISFEPTISEYALSAEDQFLCVCSDGVWEFLKADMVATILGGAKSPTDACEKVTKTAWDCWMKEENGAVVDDITAIFVRLPQLKNTSI